MPLFTSSSPFDTDVEKATDEMTTDENWALILDICDRAKQSSAASKDCLRSIMKRLNHRVPHVAMQSLTLLNACVKNSGRIFHMEVASRDFVTECRSLITDRLHPKVCLKLKLMIKSWSENEFKSDSSLALITDFYNSLKSEGHSFVSDEPPKSKVVLSKDPNVVSSQEEEEDIAKAIALSLKDAEKSTGKSVSQSTTLYPSVQSGGSSAQQQKGREPRKVRALYDFEAVEDNELTFKAGEVIGILDDSDVNWWKGASWRGEGLFPANFVTSNLTSEPEVEKEPTLEVKSVEPVVLPLRIDEDKIDKALIMLQNADPTGESCPDPPELPVAEEECKCMQPLIDQELERIDRLHGRLSEINGRLIESLQMYHNLMCEQPTYNPAVTQPAMTTIFLPQQQQVSAANVTQSYSTFPRPAAHVSLEQMLNSQPHLSLGQIPQGIVAQVGAQATSNPSAGVSLPQTAPALSATGYDPSQMTYQYAQTNVSAYATAAPPTQHSSLSYGGVVQGPFEYTSVPSFHPQQQPLFNNSSVQRQPMM